MIGNKWFWLFGVGVLFILSGCGEDTAVSLSTIFPQEAWPEVTTWQSEGTFFLDSPAHPLYEFGVNEETVSDTFQLVGLSDTAVVMNYAYRFTDKAAARLAWETFLSVVRTDGGPTNIIVPPEDDVFAYGFIGETALFVGGVLQDDVLILLIVETSGKMAVSGEELFMSGWREISQREG